MTDRIESRVAAVRERISRAAARAGRDPASVTLLAVTKGQPIEAARAAFSAGVLDLGENRAAELAVRAPTLPEARWHMVGRLQTNKVRFLPSRLAAIHSVDRRSLVERLASRYQGVPAPVVYIEVNVAGEETKGGARWAEVETLLPSLIEAGFPVSGLMTVAPAVVDAESVRPFFRELAVLARTVGLDELSMGMSDDFEVAVEEGSTLVRIGRAIFGRDHPG